ncbi:hypothetical protein OMP43_03790 [Sphingomonas sp. CBMAI 2297]|uniref:hypothetical protein n=1 Tax=Sphingomonas sp. CBMAI 2297 TaxID=2991720 RepID=UPI0024552955|nr:hypothetical protein [Sphingomonas sp. CBMAI 2297]MDH4743137.1 hypothetical protein [Sphingomonas sp. CBMAI 2297]
MSTGFDFTGNAPKPVSIKAHQVRTLPALRMALDDLVKVADDRGTKHVDLREVSPMRGVQVSLIDFGGRLYISFEGLRA